MAGFSFEAFYLWAQLAEGKVIQICRSTARFQVQ